MRGGGHCRGHKDGPELLGKWILCLSTLRHGLAGLQGTEHWLFTAQGANGLPGSKCDYQGGGEGSEQDQLAKTEEGSHGDVGEAQCNPGLKEATLSDSERHLPGACARMSVIPVRNWGTPEVPPIGSQLSEIWYIHSVESYPAVQKNKVDFHVSTWNYVQDTLSCESSRWRVKPTCGAGPTAEGVVRIQ